MNKGNICIAKTSPPPVFNAYLEQFERDFKMFLKCRAEELVPGGRMVLTTMGSIKSDDPLCIWEVVGLNLNDMVLEVMKCLTCRERHELKTISLKRKAFHNYLR